MQHRPLLFGVFADKADGRFIRHGGDGTGLKDVVLAEQRFRVAVGVALVLTGEIQIDIRRFVAVETQKGFKRNGVAVAVVFGAANGALLRRKVKARAVAAVRNEFAVFAVRADIMRRQRVYLGNTGDIGHERRADRTTRANQVTVRLRIGHKLLRRHVQHGEAVLIDGIQLALEAVVDDLRQRIAVNLFRPLP